MYGGMGCDSVARGDLEIRSCRTWNWLHMLLISSHPTYITVLTVLKQLFHLRSCALFVRTLDVKISHRRGPSTCASLYFSALQNQNIAKSFVLVSLF